MEGPSIVKNPTENEKFNKTLIHSGSNMDIGMDLGMGPVRVKAKESIGSRSRIIGNMVKSKYQNPSNHFNWNLKCICLHTEKDKEKDKDNTDYKHDKIDKDTKDKDYKNPQDWPWPCDSINCTYWINLGEKVRKNNFVIFHRNQEKLKRKNKTSNKHNSLYNQTVNNKSNHLNINKNKGIGIGIGTAMATHGVSIKEKEFFKKKMLKKSKLKMKDKKNESIVESAPLDCFLGLQGPASGLHHSEPAYHPKSPLNYPYSTKTHQLYYNYNDHDNNDNNEDVSSNNKEDGVKSNNLGNDEFNESYSNQLKADFDRDKLFISNISLPRPHPLIFSIPNFYIPLGFTYENIIPGLCLRPSANDICIASKLNIIDLPIDLLSVILCYLSPFELICIMNQVNKSFLTVLEDPLLWEHLLKIIFGENFKSSCEFVISKGNLKKFFSRLNPNSNYFFSNSNFLCDQIKNPSHHHNWKNIFISRTKALIRSFSRCRGEIYACTICGCLASFASFESLQNHINSSHILFHSALSQLNQSTQSTHLTININNFQNISPNLITEKVDADNLKKPEPVEIKNKSKRPLDFQQSTQGLHAGKKSKVAEVLEFKSRGNEYSMLETFQPCTPTSPSACVEERSFKIYERSNGYVFPCILASCDQSKIFKNFKKLFRHVLLDHKDFFRQIIQKVALLYNQNHSFSSMHSTLLNDITLPINNQYRKHEPNYLSNPDNLDSQSDSGNSNCIPSLLFMEWNFLEYILENFIQNKRGSTGHLLSEPTALTNSLSSTNNHNHLNSDLDKISLQAIQINNTDNNNCNNHKNDNDNTNNDNSNMVNISAQNNDDSLNNVMKKCLNNNDVAQGSSGLFVCSFGCGFIASRLSKRLDHETRRHDNSLGRFSCDSCRPPLKFYFKKDFIKHSAKYHPIINQP